MTPYFFFYFYSSFFSDFSFSLFQFKKKGGALLYRLITLLLFKF